MQAIPRGLRIALLSIGPEYPRASVFANYIIAKENPTRREPGGAFLYPGLSRSAGRERRQQQQRDDVGDLDHRVHGRAGGVLVGIADRIAGHRGLVGLGALAAVVAVLDVLLGVVP